MALQLYAHPFSSYCQKALIALYEHQVPFEWQELGPASKPQVQEAFAALWPLQRMPVLVDGPRTLREASIVVEYIDQHHRHPSGPALLPGDADAALDVRFLDRFFDNYVMTPMQKIVFDCIRQPEQRDEHGVAEARRLLDSAYAWLDQHLSDQRSWAAGQAFTLADCAAAPSLLYADWVHPIDASLTHARAYRQRLLARPSFARAVDEARPFRAWFPPGAPDRD